MLNGHDLKKDDVVVLILPDGTRRDQRITACTTSYIYIGEYKFYPSSGCGPNRSKSNGMRIERIEQTNSKI